jgi:hypothetical protein
MSKSTRRDRGEVKKSISVLKSLSR